MKNEMRLIDANRIVEVAERAYNAWNLANATADGAREINRVFKMMELCRAVKSVADDCPTVDAVEAVRCKDCGDWQEYGDDHICEHFSSVDLPGLCENIRFVTRPDDYCSFGFRIKQSETETEEIK